MSLELIQKEIKSPAIKSLVNEMWDTLRRVKSGEILYQQGQVENGSQKNLLASVGLDWHYNKQRKELEIIKQN